jgi:hypothetical protein
MMIGEEIKLSVQLNCAFGLGSSEAVRGSSWDTKGQEGNKGEASTATSEPVREELVQSAVSFLKHPKVVASSDVQRRSFLENKGLTVDEIEEAFRRLLVSFNFFHYLVDFHFDSTSLVVLSLFFFIDLDFVTCRARLQTLQVQMRASLKVCEKSPFTGDFNKAGLMLI